MRGRILWAAWFASLFTFGCGEIEHSDYVDARAEAECRKLASCARGYYESEWRDDGDCVDDRADNIDDFDDALPNSCDYDGEEARMCISRINSMSCEEYAEGAMGGACDLVWVCND